MVVVTPGASLQRIADGTDWTFVLDKSGSMSGDKIATLANGVCKVINKMSPLDRFRIITFDSRAYDFTEGYIMATPENVYSAIERIKTIQADGSTALYEGLKKAYKGLDEDRVTGIILVTDGVANVGPTRQAHFKDLLRNYDIRLFTFVMGNSANEPLLEMLAKESGGFAMNISSNDDIIGRIIQAKAKVLHECIYDVELKFSGEKVQDLTPVKIGNLFMGQQIVCFGRYNGSGEVELEFKGKIAGNEEVWSCKAFLPETDRDNPELERLWALSSIEDIMSEIREKGEKESLRQKVVDMGTHFSLVTDYTSMLVIREDEMESLGIKRRNAQRVSTERQAQVVRGQSPVKNYRVDSDPGRQGGSNSSGSGMFGGARAHNVGTGPVGLLFLGIAAWIRRRKLKY
jgi:Ca-activated chloride channel family protein